MWFKNIRIYRFTKPFTLTAEELDQALSAAPFVPCASQDQKRIGWVSPITGHVEQSGFAHASQSYIMVCAKRQEKVLPAAVVNELLAEKVGTIEDAEARKVGRKQRLQLKDEVMMDLLPRAFTRSQLQYAYIDPEQGYLIVDTASATRAEELINTLRDTLGTMAVVPLSTLQAPVNAMTSWVTSTLAPENTVLGEECELADAKEAGSVIRCKQQDLSSTEIANLLASGMLVTKLALHWMEGINFMLDDQLSIKRLRFEDKVHEKTDTTEAQSVAEQFDIEFSVMTIELEALISNLLKALGGVNTKTASVEEIVAKASRDEANNTKVEEVSF